MPRSSLQNLPAYARVLTPMPRQRAPHPPDDVLRLAGVRIDADHVSRYAALVGEPQSAQLPLLYPSLLGFGLQLRLLSDRRFPVPALGLLHLSNQVRTTRAIQRDAVLDVEVRATALRPHHRGRTVDLLTQVSQDGEPVWFQTSTYLHREHREPVPSGSAPLRADLDQSDRDRTGPRGADLGRGPAGELSPSACWHLPADLGRRYAALSGDVNPIHLYPLGAKALGLRRQIVHGMWTAAAVAGALVNRMPAAVLFTVEFRRPIALPSTVWLETALHGDVARARVRCGEDVALVALSQPAPAGQPTPAG